MRKLKLARLLARLSRIDVERHTAIGPRTLASWEDGDAKPNWPGVIRLSKLYGVPSDSLAGNFELADLAEGKVERA